jgi:hypothetical protein
MNREVWNHPENKNKIISMHYKLEAPRKFTDTHKYEVHLYLNVTKK